MNGNVSYPEKLSQRYVIYCKKENKNAERYFAMA